jgi:geranylgeranyl reductase family protein
VSGRCDVLIVGGGPAGSSCAHELVRAGLDVVIVDRASFPRHKPCAGWITPEVIDALDLDLTAYGSRFTLQPVTGFITGVIGGPRAVTRFDEPVSYAIRRSEFDTYLLRRCGAPVHEAVVVDGLERLADGWRVNATYEARVLVGAGGHRCPVARLLNPHDAEATVVVAQEVEVQLGEPEACPVSGLLPELYFCRDLRGYGWCVRKGDYLNVGFGRQDSHGLPDASRAFLDHVKGLRRVPAGFPTRWNGHAYRVHGRPARRIVGDRVLLAGDAAGLAHPSSGEGILPAVLSGQLAARAIIDALPDASAQRLASYEAALASGLGPPGKTPGGAGPGAALRAWAGRQLLAVPWFARHVLVSRRFLHLGSAIGRRA